MSDSAETMRTHKYVTLNADGDIWTAGIDIRKNNGDWHYNAVECHSVDRELAIARRDTVFAALSASGTKSDGTTEGRGRYAEQPGSALGCAAPRNGGAPPTEAVAGIKPGPSDPISSQPDERERIQQIIELAMIEEAEIQYADFADRDRQREKIITSAAAAIIAMQAERRGHDPLGDLVQRFADALLAKLRLAQANGRSGWDQDDWEEACRKGLMRHIEKGDPRDVAAYCAFMWHHGWSTQPITIDTTVPTTTRWQLPGWDDFWATDTTQLFALEQAQRPVIKQPLYSAAQLEAHAAEQVRAEREGGNTIQRDKIYRAAERSNTRFGQWIPERWVNIFVEEMSK